jgi:hypothetical protein
MFLGLNKLFGSERTLQSQISLTSFFEITISHGKDSCNGEYQGLIFSPTNGISPSKATILKIKMLQQDVH